MPSIGNRFSGITQPLDGEQFTDCVFDHCTLVFSASQPVSLVGCTFSNCTWTFGGAALLTLDFLRGLYTIKGMVPALVEQIFDSIKGIKPTLGP